VLEVICIKSPTELFGKLFLNNVITNLSLLVL
jgi:hypothetical protein